MLFEHYLITRFNLPIFFTLRNGNKVSACSEEYLEHRFELFEKYCLPSVAQQSNKNFKWLILFDVNTPQKFKDRALAWKQSFEEIYPFYLDLSDYKEIPTEYINLYNEYANKTNQQSFAEIDNYPGEFVQRVVSPMFIKNCIKTLSSNVPDYYLTTRLDNDDAIHVDFIDSVQKMFLENQKVCLYNYRFGYGYDLRTKVVEKGDFGNSHFTTLVESSNNVFQSVFYWSHRYVGKFVQVVHLYNDLPMYVELIHDNNAGNKYYVHYRWLLWGYRNFEPSLFGYEFSLRPSLLRTLTYFFSYDAFAEHFMKYLRKFCKIVGITYFYHKIFK